MNNLLKRSLFVAVGVLLTTSVLAQPAMQRGNQQGRQGERGPMAMLERIPDLTDQQKEDIKAIMLVGQKEHLPIRNTLAEKRAALRSLNTSDNYDEAQANALIEEIKELEGQQMKNRMEQHQQIRALLTEDQQVVFDTITSRQKRARRGKAGKRG
ncbi:MAG: Spy/CpxP family protein refolding chaperone [Bacteroidota bacterium]